MRKQLFARVTGFILSLALCVSGLALIIDGLGTGTELMLFLMRRHAPAGTTGLPDSEYPGMCGMITAYLAGSTDEFQYVWTGTDGTQYLCFHDYEQKHMEDVRSLFVLCRTVLLIAAAAAAVCVLLVFRLKRKVETLKGMRNGALALFAAVSALLVWGILDFNGFFTAFHRAAFTNSLWLLNPATDLLIRLMPSGFFMAYALLAAGTYLVIPLLLLLVPQWILRKERKQYAKHSDRL